MIGRPTYGFQASNMVHQMAHSVFETGSEKIWVDREKALAQIGRFGGVPPFSDERPESSSGQDRRHYLDEHPQTVTFVARIDFFPS